MVLKELLAEMVARQASDLHLRVGVQPILRIDGRLTTIETDRPTVESVNEILAQILTEDQKRRFEARNEMDLALAVARMGRFRVNIYRQRGTVGFAIRAVNTVIPSFSELNLPEVIKKLCQERKECRVKIACFHSCGPQEPSG